MDSNSLFHDEIAQYLQEPIIAHEATSLFQYVYRHHPAIRENASTNAWETIKSHLHKYPLVLGTPTHLSAAKYGAKTSHHDLSIASGPQPFLLPPPQWPQSGPAPPTSLSSTPQQSPFHLTGLAQAAPWPTLGLACTPPSPSLANFSSLGDLGGRTPSGTSIDRRDSTMRALTALRMMVALRLSLTCPYPEVRGQWARYLSQLEQLKYPVLSPLVNSPSFFVPSRDLVRLPVGSSLDALRQSDLLSPPLGQWESAPAEAYREGLECTDTCRIVVEAIFCHEQRLSNLCRVFMFFPMLLRKSFVNVTWQLKLHGPLSLPVRLYLGIMACAQVQSYYGVALLQAEFLRHNGPVEWLQGLEYAPEKVQMLAYINSLLVNQPWLITRHHIQSLVHGHASLDQMKQLAETKARKVSAMCVHPPGPYGQRTEFPRTLRVMSEGWSMAELSHAFFILTTCHAFGTLALSCGIAPEVDMPGGFVLHTDRWEDPNPVPFHRAVQALDGGISGDHFFASIYTRVKSYLHHTLPTGNMALSVPDDHPLAHEPAPSNSTIKPPLAIPWPQPTHHLHCAPPSPADEATQRLIQTLRGRSSAYANRLSTYSLPGLAPEAFKPDVIMCPDGPAVRLSRSSPPNFYTAPSRVPPTTTEPHIHANLFAMDDVAPPAEPGISQGHGVHNASTDTLSSAATSFDLTDSNSSGATGDADANPLAPRSLQAEVVNPATATHSKFRPLQRLQPEICDRFILSNRDQVPSGTHPVECVDGTYSFPYDLVWESHGAQQLSVYLPDHEEQISQEFQLSQDWTDGTVGSETIVDCIPNSDHIDTEPYRYAVWRFTQALCGVHISTYEYSDIPLFLNERARQYITKLVTKPHTLTAHDFYFGLGLRLRIDEICFLNFLVAQAKRQAALMLALRKIT
ncbi:hypothetical protein H4R34_003562 [Dimargaris verticillata]|uniref:PA26 p53-induced protein-domain-containing protein n=1 Tax=Dimargaris verticillata TaxID=2761393 RepID=A0A9W8B4B0_9FUNG|nr:hypothetical protein H4R34_003562 [Dimargaris verticillata]